jgi:hypothetical protein
MNISREEPYVPYCMFIENVSLHSDLRSASQRVLVSHHNEEVRFELATDVPELERDHLVQSFLFTSCTPLLSLS